MLAFHILRSRRVEVQVSSTIGWEHVDRPVAAARPWQRLRSSLPLILQVLVVILTALALAGPAIDSGRVSARHLVVILDTSSSMGATDGSPNRLADAKRVTEGLAGDLGEGAVVTVIAAGAPAHVAVNSVPASAVGSALEGVRLSEGPFDAQAASSLALGLDSAEKSVAYALVSDGGLDGAAVRLLPPGTKYHRVGKRSQNLGITNVVSGGAGDQMHLQVTVTNAGGDARSSDVRVDVDDRTVTSRTVRVDGNDNVEVGFDLPAGTRIAVHLDEDLLSSDNHAYAVGPAERKLKVARIGGSNPFLDALLDDRPTLQITKAASLAELSPGEADAVAALSRFDLVLFDQVAVPEDMPVAWFGIAPPQGAPGVAVTGQSEAPVPALVRSDNALLEGLDLSELAIAQSQRIDAPGATTLIGAEDTPLLVMGNQTAARFVYLGFTLDQSNLALLPQFPVLGDRIITTLAGTDLTSGALRVGDALPIDSASDAVVESPSGARTRVRAGELPPELDRTGIWSITSGGKGQNTNTRLAVANPSPPETQITPRKGLAIPGVEAARNDAGAPVRWSLTVAALMAACALVATEWWSSARRRGVGLGQWRWATGVRIAVFALLVLAMVIPSFRVSSSKVSTVFVLDASDSMAGGRDRAIDTVARAVSEMPANSVAGVVVVGGDARVDSAVAASLQWKRPSVRVDGSATDLAAGVRLAGAMSSGDRARRVVLISDGRPTAGNLDGELRRLRSSGTRLDVVPVDPGAGPDVMVSSVEVPGRARPGEQVVITANIVATEAQRASVVLKRDDVEVERRLVDLPKGATKVSFTQPAVQPSTVEWSVSVGGPANGVLENDLARGTTVVEGSAKVLLVEGSPGEAAALAAVMKSSGTQTTIISPEQIPNSTELASNDAVVLVNVALTSMSPTQESSIVAASRDLGTGLLVVGGPSSYGAGAYLGSDLESVLPVISEVKDPKRRSKVAQVFAVDVSGSMGACHCAEGGAGQNARISAGVKKSDIARDAAVLSLSGIQPGDELGVIALDDQYRWVMDVAPVGDGNKARTAIGKLKNRDRSTNLLPGLTESAKQLRDTNATIRHIVLFTDGFEDQARLSQLATEAAKLRDEGITVSVMGTGEGAAKELRAIAEAGGGRYYPGRDLSQLPNLLLEETRVVSRQMLVEGEFVPERTSNGPAVASLDSAPSIQGFVATTPRPTATQHLRVGPERDPLLVSWQVGLGKVAAWTSDAGARWASGWVAWEGAPTFWTNLLRSVYRSPAGEVQITFDDASAKVVAGFDNAVPDGANVEAVVVAPDGSTTTVSLKRKDDSTFEGTFPTTVAGSYGVGVRARVGGTDAGSITGVADLGYSREYAPLPPDRDLLINASRSTEGRGAITADQAFDSAGLVPGRRSVDLRNWLILLAALLWPVAVGLSRLRLAKGADAMVLRERLGRVGTATDAIKGIRQSRRLAEKSSVDASSVDASSTGAQHGAGAPTGASLGSTSGNAQPTPGAPTGASPGSTSGATQGRTARSKRSRGSDGSDSQPSADAPAGASKSPGGGSTLDSLLAAKRERRRPEDPPS